MLSQGLANLSTRILGSNTLVQGALPAILQNTPKKFFDGLVNTLYVSNIIQLPLAIFYKFVLFIFPCRNMPSSHSTYSMKRMVCDQ